MFAISEVEQQMITGVSVNGNSVNTISDDKVRTNLMNLLGRLEVDFVNKKRLLLLWFINYGWKYTSASHEKVIASCEPGLGVDGMKLVAFLNEYVRIPRHNKGFDKAEKKILDNIRSNVQKRTKQREAGNGLSTRLHEPKLIEIVRSHIEMELSKKEYPWVDPANPEESNCEPEWYSNGVGTTSRGKSRRGGGGKKLGGSLGKHRLNNSLQFGAKQVNAIAAVKVVDNVNVAGFKFEGARLIVCAFGGVTYSELRGLYDLMQEKRCEIIVCATDILTPSHFLRSLRGMQGPADDSDSEDDEVLPSNVSLN
jgi:hypothetical protein